jgi:thiol-disulfide isomerase/thioredoxin
MRLRFLFAAVLAVSLAMPAAESIVRQVRLLLGQKKFAEAEAAVAAYRARAGITPDAAEAVSWLGRGALGAKNLDAAERHAAEARRMSLELLRSRKVDAEPRLPTALGAAIEVHAQVLAARGERSEAVQFLEQELAAWRETAPAFSSSRWLGGPAPAPAGWRGRTVLLFLWAHWCGDCKAMAPALAGIRDAYQARGLVLIAPTRTYGYVAGGQDAGPEEEARYIETAWKAHYGTLAGALVPLSSEIFHSYGVSTTPTLVLLDRTGVVRMYHPGAMSAAELKARVEAALAL